MRREAAPDPALFAPDYQEIPHWWEAAPRPVTVDAVLPPEADVAIVGSGITGLNAAIILARAGRRVVVLDAEDAGAGASSRNLGFVGQVLKHEFGTLLRRLGLDRARRIYAEMQAAFDAVGEVVRAESIDCHLETCGRLILAASAQQFSELRAELDLRQQHLGKAHTLLTAAELPSEIASDRFVGGALIPDLAAIHPGLYHLGLLAAARAAGAIVQGRTTVNNIVRDSEGLTLITSRGPLPTTEIIIATNGYTGGGAPGWIRRRVIPFDAYIMATEQLPPDRIEALLPRHRTFIDCNHNLFSFRRAPDGTRILFCGLTGTPTPSLRHRAASLHALACAILPGMAQVRIGRAWTGNCAGTFDLYPHMAERGNIHFAGGYCFAGVPMGTYLGRKLAWRLLGRRDEAATVFAERRFPTIPFYTGRPWFVPSVMRAYDWMDARAGGRLA